MTGIIKSFNNARGYGFLFPLCGRPTEVQNVFFHISACHGSVPPIGCEVSFTLVRGNKGAQAADVTLVKLGSAALKRT